MISHGNFCYIKLVILRFESSEELKLGKSTKKIKNPHQIAFVHTMWSVRLNRRLGAERHTEPGGMNHRQIIGPITNRNSLVHTDAHV